MKYPTVNQILYVPIFTRSQILVQHVQLLWGRIFVELCWDMIMKDWCYHSCKWMVHMQFSAVSQDTQVIIYPKSLTWKLTLTYLRQQRKYLFVFSTQIRMVVRPILLEVPFKHSILNQTADANTCVNVSAFFDPVPPGPSRTLQDPSMTHQVPPGPTGPCRSKQGPAGLNKSHKGSNMIELVPVGPIRSHQ